MYFEGKETMTAVLDRTRPDEINEGLMVCCRFQ